MPKISINITIDTDDITALVEKAGKYVFDPALEDALVNFVSQKAAFEDAEARIKLAISEAGLKLNPGFTGVQSDKLRANYSFHGALYGIEEDKVSSEFVKKKVTYSPNKDVIEKFAEVHGSLPVGVFKHERSKSLTLTIKEPKIAKE